MSRGNDGGEGIRSLFFLFAFLFFLCVSPSSSSRDDFVRAPCLSSLIASSLRSLRRVLCCCL
jgi:hypothetical protein